MSVKNKNVKRFKNIEAKKVKKVQISITVSIAFKRSMIEN